VAEVCDEKHSKVGSCKSLGVERHVDHAHVRPRHGPHISSPEQSVREEHPEVANSRVLDGGHLLPVILQVPVDRDFLPRSKTLTKNDVIRTQFPLIGETETITKLLKSNGVVRMIEVKAHSVVLMMIGEGVLEAREELLGKLVEGVRLQRGEDAHAGIVHQGVEVLLHALPREEGFVGPPYRQHLARGDSREVRVDGSTQRRTLTAAL